MHEKLEQKTYKLKIKHDEGLLSTGNYKMGVLTALLHYRMAAEGNPDRIKYICDKMIETVNNGKAAFAACNFRGTIHKCVKYLMDTYNVPRDCISLIWGGGISAMTEKQKAKKAFEENEEMMAALTAAGLTLADVNLDDIEVSNVETVDPKYGLGMQNMKERQKEIDKYQSGKPRLFYFSPPLS